MYGNEEYIQEMVELCEAQRHKQQDFVRLVFQTAYVTNDMVKLLFFTADKKWKYHYQLDLEDGWIRYAYHLLDQPVAKAIVFEVGLCSSRVASLAMEKLKEAKKE